MTDYHDADEEAPATPPRALPLRLTYSDDLEGGLLRRHQHRCISPKAAAAWLRCTREVLVARGLDAEQIMPPLARIAKAMIHSPETSSNDLRKGCDAVQDPARVQFEKLLDDAGNGGTEIIRRALEKDRSLASRRGTDNRTLAWVATYRNRPKILERGAEVKRHSGKLLTLAVVMNRVDLVKLLIEHGGDVERTRFLGRLDDAERPVADLLIAHGKKVPDWMLPHACRPDVSTNEVHRVTVLLDYGASVNDRGRYGLSALHYAVRGGKLPLIQLLLERGAAVDALDANGVTPLLHLIA